LYRVALEAILGFRPQDQTLSIEPCDPTFGEMPHPCGQQGRSLPRGVFDCAGWRTTDGHKSVACQWWSFPRRPSDPRL